MRYFSGFTGFLILYIVSNTAHYVTLPFVGKILIDDVYSGGSKEDGNYPLLSRAMELGLYHPRCKDSHSTYFEGISTPPDDHFTEKDIEEIKDGYTDEQKQNVAQHNYRKYSRMAEHSLDKENQQKYNAKAEYWMGEYNRLYNRTNKTDQQSRWDKGQYERYKKVLWDMAPESIEKFLEIKYNDSVGYGKLKHAYRIANQYENNSGIMPPSKIVELHDFAVDCKAKFTGNARKNANIGAMILDGKTYIANSRANKITDSAYYNYKGDKTQIILKPEKIEFKAMVVGTHLRDVDSEYKFFEFATNVVKDGKPHMIEILSEKAMCKSCQSVMKEFKKKYPNVSVTVVSHKLEKAEKHHNSNPIFEYDTKRKFENENN